MTDVLVENFNLLKQIFTICNTTKADSKEMKISTHEAVKVASLLFAFMKKINRLIKYKIRAGREHLKAQRALVDCNKSYLQNLLYEANYLNREIRLCYQFKSQDEDIEYYDGQMVCESSKLTHKQRIECLKRELHLRKVLAEEYSELLNTKKHIFEQIVTKVEQLSAFKPLLNILLQSAQPLQDILQLPLEENWALEKNAHLLSSDLYLAYVNLNLTQDDDNYVCVSIRGSHDEAYAYEDYRKATPTTDLTVDQFLAPHPLHLKIEMENAEFNKDAVVIQIYSFTSLDLVTAECAVYLMENTIHESYFARNFLKYICEDDTGSNMPFAEVESKLYKRNLSVEDCFDYFYENNYGKPYMWLQQLCGVSKRSVLKNCGGPCEKLQQFSSAIMERIKKYWQARLRILSQVKTFMNKNLSNYINSRPPHCHPNCSLVQWSFVSWEEYASNPATHHYISDGLADKDCGFFRAIVVFGSAKMDCLISISNKYVGRAPLWIITIHWNGQRNAANNSAIKMMEYWTNCIQDIEDNTCLLAAQLLRTMYSFDVYLETESPLYEPLEFKKEKCFIKSFRRRMRVRPYRQLYQDPIYYYTQ